MQFTNEHVVYVQVSFLKQKKILIEEILPINFFFWVGKKKNQQLQPNTSLSCSI